MYKYFKVGFENENDLGKLVEAAKDNNITLKQYDTPLDIFIEEEAEFRLDAELKWSARKNLVLDKDRRENIISNIITEMDNNVDSITDNEYISELTTNAIKEVVPDFYE